MIKKLTKYGNSLALIVDKPILDLLKIDQTTELEISTDGNRLFIKPRVSITRHGIISEDTKLQKTYKKLVKKYKPALKKLAKQ